MFVYTLEQRWEMLRNYFCRFWQKKIIFSDRFDLGGYVNKRNCRIYATANPYAYIEKPAHPKLVTFWCGFWFRSIMEPLFFENEQGEAVTVNGDLYWAMLNEFLFTKIEDEDIGNKRTALRATQPKLHSMFCALLLKIALSAAKLMTFRQLKAAIWYGMACRGSHLNEIIFHY